MSPVVIVLLGCVAVLGFDGLGSLAARRLGFNYAALAPGSLILYAATGFFAAREAETWLLGAVAGAAVAAVESKIGWRISRLIGVDSEDRITPNAEARATAAVTIGGAVLGVLAGLAA